MIAALHPLLHQRRLHVYDRSVADERARIDHTARTHLEAGDRDVVGDLSAPIRNSIDLRYIAEQGENQYVVETYLPADL